MNYSKPQVTIDLEEYNELLKLKSEQDSDLSKKALCIVLNAFNTPAQIPLVVEELKRNKIGIRVTDTQGKKLEPQNIVIRELTF